MTTHPHNAQRRTLATAVTTILAATAIAATPAPADADVVTAGVPDRVIVLTGSSDSIKPTVMTVLYDTRDVHFHDLAVPRYLFVDREGTTVLGIGGSVLGLVEYDFDGAIGKAGFVPRLIPVPAQPGHRQRLNFDASHSSLYLKLVRTTRFGILTAYLQSNFTGDDGGYGMKLKQAYVTLANLTLGLTNSTFADPSSIPPTVDYQGPAGQCSGKTILARYQRKFRSGIVAAASVEMPKFDITYGSQATSAYQRFPDIPIYIQYEWDKAKSHVRLSAILRRLSYLDLTDQTTRYATGWGTQLSAVKRLRPLTLYAQATYGHGIAQYLNDLSGAGFDLVPSPTSPGRLEAPASLAALAGVRYDITSRIFACAVFNFCRLYDQRQLGPDTYSRGEYYAANLFYTPLSDLQLGIEYVRGTRHNVDRQSASANRVEAMFKYFF